LSIVSLPGGVSCEPDESARPVLPDLPST